MDEYECGSSGVWNVFLDVPIYYVVISIYYWYLPSSGIMCCDALLLCWRG